MATDLRRLLQICEEALTKEGAARAAFLNETCGRETELRRAVDSLLDENDLPRDFLETPAWSPQEGRLAAGTRIGPYEILSLLGSGGMGEVYKALDTRLGRTVAIKVLPPELANDPARRARFRHEGRAVSALNHPHICTLYDIGSERGVDFLVMEYLEGETLAARLAKGPLPVRDALEYASQMADALANAHGRGLVHRDLKPANVMLTSAGAKLLDFGIAKLNAAAAAGSNDPSLTTDGLVVGTLAYMAPEQLRGQPVDARSDIFSFGALLYEMFAGRRAFQGASHTAVIAAILECDPPAVNKVQPGTPPAIDDVVRKCLARDPGARWQSAAEIREELGRIAEGSGAPAGGTSIVSWRKHRPALIAIVVVIAAVLVAFAGRGLLRSSRAADAQGTHSSAAGGAHPFGRDADVTLTAVTHEPGAESFPSISPDGREFVYATGPLDFFGESDIYRRDVGFDRAFNLTPDSPGADTQPAFSPDGNQIAFRSDRDGGGLFVMRRDGSAVRRLTNDGYNPAWSPDGRAIAYATVHTMASPFANRGNGSLWTVDVASGQRRLVRSTNAAQPSWSPHGHRIAYWADGAVLTCTPDGREVVTVIDSAAQGTAARTTNWNPVWSPDGAYLYFVSNRAGPMHLWRVRIDERSGRALDRPERTPVQMPSTFVAHASFDASGRRILFASVPTTASILRADFDIGSGAVRGILKPVTTGSVVTVFPAVSPDGTRLAFQSSTGADAIYVASAANGSQQRLLMEGARGPRWSPDGRRIAVYSTSSGQPSIWVVDADGGHPRQVTSSTRAPAIFPAWSPDGRIAASERQPGSRSFVFDPEKPWDETANLTLLPPPGADLQFVPWSWSPTGDRLAGFARRTSAGAPQPPPGVLVLTLATRKYERVTSDGQQPTPVWLPDGQRLLYAVSNAVRLVDLRTRRTRELLNVGTGRLEAAAGGGFAVSAATGHLYVAPVMRDGDIWLAQIK